MAGSRAVTLLSTTRRGLSLIEVVVSISLLALVFVSILTLIPSSTLAIRRTERRQQAITLALNILERERAAGPGTRIMGSRTLAPVIIGDTTVLMPSILVEPGSSSVPEQQLLRITVTIDWTDQNRPQQVRETTLVAAFPRPIKSRAPAPAPARARGFAAEQSISS